MKNSEKSAKNFQKDSSGKNIVLSSMSMLDKNEKNGTYALRMSRRFLIILGVWQWSKAEKSPLRFALKICSVFMCYAGLGMCVIPTGLAIALTKDPIGKIKLTGPWSFCLMAALKYFFLRYHRRDIEKCVNHIHLDWSTVENLGNKKIMLEYARYGHLVTTACAIFSFSGGLFFSILPFVVGRSRSNDNNNATIIRQFSLPSNFVFFDATKTPIFEIIYGYQIFASFMMHSIAVTCYSLAVVVVMHVCGQLKILMKNLSELVDEQHENSKSEHFHKNISLIVEHHVKTLRLISFGERMLREICLVDLGGATLNLCFLGFFFMLEWAMEVSDPIALTTYVILFASFLFNIFSFCYIGELLTGECKRVGETTYMIDWYNLPHKKTRDLCLIITMAQKSMNLTAGGAIQFSYVCFTTVVKTSMGYLNMLRAMMN